jgi:hypothetical protein
MKKSPPETMVLSCIEMKKPGNFFLNFASTLGLSMQARSEYA